MAIRRLPVIQEPTGDDAEAASRRGWQWVLIGSGLLVTIWMPFLVLALILARKISEVRGAATGPGVAASLLAATFALSAVAAGYLVARFGQRTRPRHAILAGLLAAAEIWSLALLAGKGSSGQVGASAFLTLSALAAAFCALGAWLHRRKKSSR